MFVGDTPGHWGESGSLGAAPLLFVHVSRGADVLQRPAEAVISRLSNGM